MLSMIRKCGIVGTKICVGQDNLLWVPVITNNFLERNGISIFLHKQLNAGAFQYYNRRSAFCLSFAKHNSLCTCTTLMLRLNLFYFVYTVSLLQ